MLKIILCSLGLALSCGIASGSEWSSSDNGGIISNQGNATVQGECQDGYALFSAIIPQDSSFALSDGSGVFAAGTVMVDVGLNEAPRHLSLQENLLNFSSIMLLGLNPDKMQKINQHGHLYGFSKSPWKNVIYVAGIFKADRGMDAFQSFLDRNVAPAVIVAETEGIKFITARAVVSRGNVNVKIELDDPTVGKFISSCVGTFRGAGLLSEMREQDERAAKERAERRAIRQAMAKKQEEDAEKAKKNETKQLTQTEMNTLLRGQIEKCWNIPAGAEDAKDLKVSVKFRLDRSGALEGMPQIVSGGGGDRLHRAAADSARRAVMQCAPYNLPADKYQAWAEVTINFDPSDMF